MFVWRLSVGLFVYLSDCQQLNLKKKTIDRIFIKILPQMYFWKRKIQLNSGSHSIWIRIWDFFRDSSNCIEGIFIFISFGRWRHGIQWVRQPHCVLLECVLLHNSWYCDNFYIVALDRGLHCPSALVATCHGAYQWL